LYPGFLEAVRAVSPRVETVLLSNDEPPPPEVKDATVLYRSYALDQPIVDEVLARAPNLRWLHVPADGVDPVLTPNVMDADIVITRMGDTYGGPVAELALALMLAAAKRLPAYFEAQREGRWLRAASWDEVHHEPTIPTLLRGRTIGMVGFGGIGGTLAQMVRPLGMRVLALRRNPRPDPRAERVYGPEGLREMLPECDYVVLAMPLSPATRGMLGPREIEAMKPTAWLINVARGKLVDDAALLAALEAGRIAGACLDVFATEPLPSDHPYYRLPNVILTPHVGGAFAELNTFDRDVFVDQLRRFVAGEPLRFVVDRQHWY
jgi:phosphoglycerate dehydrogenase-like enzyme